MSRKINWASAIEKMSTMDKKGGQGERTQDLNLYSPKLKEEGTYDAIIRFLPSNDTDLPFVVVHNHGFQGSTGKWFIENCPKTHGKKCPACEQATKLWNAGDETGARKRFKKFSAYSNILVIKDAQNPENEGKVFIYRYGKKLFETIKAKMVPENTEIDEPVIVFDYETGANFKLKIRSKVVDINGQKKKFPNYDSSEFMAPSALSEKVIDEVESKLLPLKTYIDDEQFKSYDALSRQIAEVEGLGEVETPKAKATPKAEKVEEDEDDSDFFARLKGE